MAIRNVWSVLCKDILIDQETNSVSYIRCLEEACASELPVQLGPAFVATLWEKENDEVDEIAFRIVLLSPSKDKQIILSTKPVRLDKPKHRLHFRIGSLELNEFGRHVISLEWKKEKYWTKVSQLPLIISNIS